MSLKILVTCPPMLGMIREFFSHANACGFELVPEKVTQTLSEKKLIELLPKFDGWIIGDDPATRQVFTAGKHGKLKAAIKWGIGVDNVDFTACRELDIPITNTPMMFGAEVADVALAYIIGLSRQLFFIDRDIRSSLSWPKPAGISLSGKQIGVIGYGDIGRQLTKRLLVCDMNVTVYDPYTKIDTAINNIKHAMWPEKVNEMDFLVFTCSLSQTNKHMLNADVLDHCKTDVRIVNVARGLLIHESALIDAIISGKVHSAALDVFEEEPLPKNSLLRTMPQCIFGSHNSSNSKDAVRRASFEAINKLKNFFIHLRERCEN